MAFLFLRFRISFDYIPEDIGRTREQHFASRTKDAGKCWTLEVSCYSITREEMAEVLTHEAFYAGWPNAWAAFRIMKEVYGEAETAEEEK